jgi:hypothetical protein
MGRHRPAEISESRKWHTSSHPERGINRKDRDNTDMATSR